MSMEDAIDIKRERVGVSRVWIGRRPLKVSTPHGMFLVRAVWCEEKRRKKYEILRGETVTETAYLLATLNRYLLTGQK